VRIRPATIDDLDAIVNGNLALAVETEHLQLDRATLTEGVRSLLEQRVPGRYWVAERGDSVIGQLMVTFEWSDWRNRMVWWIQSVYVAADARREGVFRGSTIWRGRRRGRPAPVDCASMSTPVTRERNVSTPPSA
jgi:L-amino acid N-acyltransferase YncA